jgi:predicted molibdopterin-dependent oxidoreductase YjgC
MIPGWRFLAAVAAELGSDLTPESPADVFDALSQEVPFYDTLTYEEIGGTGLRWGDRDPGQSWTPGRPEGTSGGGPTPPGVPPVAPSDRPSAEELVLGTYRDLWATDVTKRNPALRFLMPRQKLEIAATDAEFLELANGDDVTVAVNGHSVEATVAIRDRMKEGAAFLIEGTDDANANVLTNGVPQEIRVSKR